jgi:hypothetical protein
MVNEVKLSPELKQRWVEALRSGQYPQGKGLLKNYESEYCCLGVLCDLNDPIKWHLGEKDGNTYYIDEYDVLPLDLCIKTGLNPMGAIPGLKDKYNQQISLAFLNDNGFTFSQIADIIEHFL